MSKLVRPFLALSLAAALSGCNGVGPFAAAPEVEQQAILDPSVRNVPEPEDALARAKKFFHDRNFGLAEQSFRKVIEKSPNEIEAWLGLAACHDELGRFDLADREYAQVARRKGATFELLNNRGYSYMMRGDLTRARRDFNAARRMDPESEFVRNNLQLLDEKAAGRG